MNKEEKRRASPEELWKYCLQEYQSRNPLAKFLLDRYFKDIRALLTVFDKESHLLEVGCGAGESSRRISTMLSGQYFEASEYDRRYVQLLRKNQVPFKVTQESVYALKRGDAEFDGIFLLEVLEHLNDVDLALKELFRVSRRFVVISVPNDPIWRMMNMLRFKYLKSLGNTPDHVHHWSVSSLKKLVSRFGVIRKIYTPLPWIIVLVEKKSAA